MKQSSHLATAAFWIGLLTLFGWQADAQIPRPPLPIPPPTSAPRPPASTVALMPPTVPLLRSAPTPIPPPAPERPQPTPAMMPVPSHIALPPAEFDHQYAGKLTVLKEDNYVFIRHVCKDTVNAIACSFRTYDSVTGEPISCLIMLGPATWNDERALRHEMGHCNGWTNDHEGARYGN